MDTAEIRHRNFQNIYAKFRQDNSEHPDRGMLRLFAETLEMSSAYLSHIKTNRKNMGAATARNIEEKLGLPHGYMDKVNSNEKLTASAVEKAFIESALLLYRNNPTEAQALVMSKLVALAKSKR